jgi:uncharacterized protein
MMVECLLKRMVVGFSLLGLLSFPLSALAEEPLRNTITVQGNAQVTAQPDSFQIDVGVVTQGNTVEVAREENARKMMQVIAHLKALNLSGLIITTMGLNVYPLQERKRFELETPPKIIGYRVDNVIQIKLEGAPLDNLSRYASQVVDTALAEGTNTASGINFYLSKRNNAQSEALTLAIQQARKSAEVIAAASGVHLTGIYNIEAFGQSYTPTRMSTSAMATMQASTPIETGNLDINANVTVRFNFEN